MTGQRGSSTSSDRLLAGWGRTAPTAATVSQVSDADDVARVLLQAKSTGRQALARGLGRSYGDAAQCAGGMVIDGTGMHRVFEVDADAGRVRVGGGVSLDSLMRQFLPQGWFVPVTPGTRQVTVGGAIAADIHGKNHHRDGSFASHVSRLSLVTPTGAHELDPRGTPDLFWATAGGMGLTGVVVDATILMVPVETAWMMVDTERASDLDDCMDRMEAGDDGYRYSVAWIDCLARGARTGRSVLTRGDHATLDDLPPPLRSSATRFEPSSTLDIPVTSPVNVLNPLTVKAFNEMWYRKAPRRRMGHLEPIASFFHPLDGVGSWNRLYGKRGFVQYQFVVPLGAGAVLRGILEALSSAHVASFLAVLKRFGPGDAGPLSFPQEGWTLALDLPIGPKGLGLLLDRLDDAVAEAGGRVYLAKDGRLRPELVEVMYPRLPEWRTIQRGVDPDAVLSSDLSRRLGLIAPADAGHPSHVRRDLQYLP
jgi:decaprenylphospho-beta-D-ribofuranose 2-oxidase